MEPFSSAPQTVQVESEKADQTVYVEELGGEGDYWLSITDASRVCRVQDVSIRRAIARGALPVRRQRAGQNKRTRFVRASDLPHVGFPIIDESAAITTEIGKADILSIPRQQQRILQDHQQLMARLQELQETITHDQAQVHANLQQQREDSQAGLQALRQEQIQQLAALETHLLQGQEKLQQGLIAIEQRLIQEQQTLRQDMTRSQEESLQRETRIRELVHAQQAEFAASQQEVQRSQAALVEAQQQTMQTYQQSVDTRLQQAERDASKRQTAYEQQLTSSLESYVKKLDARLTTVTEQFSLAQQSSEQLTRSITTRNQNVDSVLERQQTQLDQHAQLLPLLPYAQQRLLTEQTMSEWTQALAALEHRLLTAQQQALAPYQPLLALLAPEHLETLAQLLKDFRVQDKS